MKILKESGKFKPATGVTAERMGKETDGCLDDGSYGNSNNALIKFIDIPL